MLIYDRMRQGTLGAFRFLAVLASQNVTRVVHFTGSYASSDAAKRDNRKIGRPACRVAASLREMFVGEGSAREYFGNARLLASERA